MKHFPNDRKMICDENLPFCLFKILIKKILFTGKFEYLLIRLIKRMEKTIKMCLKNI